MSKNEPKKLYSALVNIDGTASATIYVMATKDDDVGSLILEAARAGEGSFEWNDGNTPYSYDLCGGDDDIELVADSVGVDTRKEWDALDPSLPVYWPRDAGQPYTKQELADYCHNNSDWAWKLYTALHDRGGEDSPDTLITEAGGIEPLLFGNLGNLHRLLRLLKEAQVVSVDDGPLLHRWHFSDDIDVTQPNSEVVHFSWVDDEGLTYGDTLAIEGIQAGKWVGDKFVCYNSEGDPTTVKFFKLQPLL